MSRRAFSVITGPSAAGDVLGAMVAASGTLDQGITHLQDPVDRAELSEKPALFGLHLESGLAGGEHGDRCAGRDRGAVSEAPFDQARAIVTGHSARNHNTGKRGWGHQDSPAELRASCRIVWTSRAALGSTRSSRDRTLGMGTGSAPIARAAKGRRADSATAAITAEPTPYGAGVSSSTQSLPVLATDAATSSESKGQSWVKTMNSKRSSSLTNRSFMAISATSTMPPWVTRVTSPARPSAGK